MEKEIKEKITIEQALLDKILFIGDEIPEGVANDKRPKFVILGNPQKLIDEVVNKSERELIHWIAEYAYYKANPETKMDVPSIVYEQVEKDFEKFLANTLAKKEIKEKRKDWVKITKQIPTRELEIELAIRKAEKAGVFKNLCKQKKK